METTGKRRFMKMLQQLHKQFNVGILIIEHDIETISRLCDRVAALDFGRLIALGTPDEVFSNPEVVRSYTGGQARSEEHTSELQSLMRISYAVFCLTKKKM